MKKLILASVLAFAPMMASAADLKPQATPDQVPAGECTAKGISAFFDETSTGLRCPAVGWEKAVGEITFGAVALAVGAEALGADVFPLNAGIFSGL